MFRDDDIYIAKEIVDNVDITDKPKIIWLMFVVIWIAKVTNDKQTDDFTDVRGNLRL